MRKEMSSLDLFFLQKEFDRIVGGRIEKIYQSDRIIQIDVYSKKGKVSLYFEPGKLFLSEYKRQFPMEPEHFCNFLRKHLIGAKIKDARQYDFERIVEIETDDNILVLELFSKGNAILCDKSFSIMMPLDAQIWKDRQILPKKPYKYPPPVVNPFSLDMARLRMFLINNEKSLVGMLAIDFGLSGTYAEEVCFRANIEKTKRAKDLGGDELFRLHGAIYSLMKGYDPQITYESGKPFEVSPFLLQMFKDRKRSSFKNFSSALDEYFTGKHSEMIEQRKSEKMEDEKQRTERIKERQQKSLALITEREELCRKTGELIYSKFQEISPVLSVIEKAKKAGKKWPKIKELLKEYPMVKEVREKKSEMILILDSTEVALDFRKDLKENANLFFEEAKKMRKKMESTEKSIKKVEEEMKGLLEKGVKSEERKPVKIREKEWFEKFRWTVSSEGFLMIGGRDAIQNEMIFKKYIGKDDLVLHAEIPGSPLVVIKSEGKPITPQATKEAAEFAAAYSSAWKKGLGDADVFYVRPDQISKSPPPGQYLAKGSFMIYGQKSYLRKVPLNLSIGIGVKDGNAFAVNGNMKNLQGKVKFIVNIVPGDLTQNELAKSIKHKALQAAQEDKEAIEKLDISEIQRLIPAGKSNYI